MTPSRTTKAQSRRWAARSAEDNKTSIIAYSEAFEGLDQENWPKMIEWLVAHIRRFEKAFDPHVDALRQLLKTQFPKTDATEEGGNGGGA